MLYLQNISLLQFKNYQNRQFAFTQNIVGICGNNGKGKTNLLDAIYLACFSKSYFSRSDAANVQKGSMGMRVEANFLKQSASEKIICILRENNKKELQRNGEDYKKFSLHIGQFPAVMIAPDDVELITGGSETRRKFLDTLLCQLDPGYLQWLITYNKILLQRNSLLKSVGDRGYVDEALLQVLNTQLVKPGQLIFERRKEFLQQFLPEVQQRYTQIAGSTETIGISYYSPLQEDSFARLLSVFKQKDLLLQRTTIGIHKDELEITLNDEPFKNIASQGQRKSMLFALKLAEFDTLKTAKGFAPLLLLDDVFEKLDAGRINNLLQQVCKQNDCHIFITDTHFDRLQVALQNLNTPFQMIELD